MSTAPAFDPALLDELITEGDWIATARGPLPVPAPIQEPPPPDLLEHEKALPAAILADPPTTAPCGACSAAASACASTRRCRRGSGAPASYG